MNSFQESYVVFPPFGGAALFTVPLQEAMVWSAIGYVVVGLFSCQHLVTSFKGN